MGHGPAVAVEDVIQRVDAWRGRAVSVRPLARGLTNTNYRVEVDGQAYVVRIPGESTELLGIDRANERHNARIAAALGIGPRIVQELPDLGATVAEFLDGRPLTNADLQAPDMPARIAGTLRVLHGGPRFLRDFDMFALGQRYVGLLVRRGWPLPRGYRARQAAIRRIGGVLAARRLPAVPCHNDLLADNYIEQDGRLRLVDWEYSGNGDPTFELGNTCRELDYDEARIAALCRAYFGRDMDALVARVRLQTIVSDVGWALWAAVQTAISRLDVDFARYGAGRWGRAEAAMDGADVVRWLDAARRSGEGAP
jgi:thiamine kinase-like enzyme